MLDVPPRSHATSNTARPPDLFARETDDTNPALDVSGGEEVRLQELHWDGVTVWWTWCPRLKSDLEPATYGGEEGGPWGEIREHEGSIWKGGKGGIVDQTFLSLFLQIPRLGSKKDHRTYAWGSKSLAKTIRLKDQREVENDEVRWRAHMGPKLKRDSPASSWAGLAVWKRVNTNKWRGVHVGDGKQRTL